MKRWSIARRMTVWFAATTASLILMIVGLSGWFLYQSVVRELDALAKEELDEARVLFGATAGTVEDLGHITQELAEEHPANPLAWRVWERDGTPWAEFGSAELLAHMPSFDQPGEVTVGLGKGLRWRIESLGERRLGLVLDGSAQQVLLRRYGVFSGVLVVVSSLLAWFVASALSRKTSRMLRLVAQGARAVREPRSAIEFSGADLPEEIGDVADALSEMLAKIRSETERADLMTSGLAHELRSPIQNLMGEAEVALLRDREPDEYRRVLESQVEELRELARAVDNLVTLCSRRELEETSETFDLGQEARLRFLRDTVQAARRGVRLELECSGELGLEGDREALLLALRNLVSNAVEWSPESAAVHVSIEGGPEQIEIRVEDEGPGIPSDVRERVFEPFQQGPQGEGRRVGFGLGLALARTAVEIHGGSIAIEDGAQGGALLRVRLPRSVSDRQPNGSLSSDRS